MLRAAGSNIASSLWDGSVMNSSFFYTISPPEISHFSARPGEELHRQCLSSHPKDLFTRVLFHWSVKYCVYRGTEPSAGTV